MKYLAIFALFLCSCVSVPAVGTGAVKISLVDITENKYSGDRLRVRFEHEEDYEGFVQEVRLDTGETLVEYFDGCCVVDNHWRGSLNSETHCVVYPATVEDIDATTTGFGHLPENRDGTVKTRIGPGFNSSYQKKYKTQGRVVKDLRAKATRWRIEWKDGRVSYYVE